MRVRGESFADNRARYRVDAALARWALDGLMARGFDPAYAHKTRYEGGLVDFLDVLDAERTQLADEDRLAQSRADAATSLVAVYKALGGGWEDAPVPRYVRQAGG